MGLVPRVRQLAEWQAAEQSRTVRAQVVSYNKKTNRYVVEYRGAEFEVRNLAEYVVTPGKEVTLYFRGVRPEGAA